MIEQINCFTSAYLAKIRNNTNMWRLEELFAEMNAVVWEM